MQERGSEAEGVTSIVRDAVGAYAVSVPDTGRSIYVMPVPDLGRSIRSYRTSHSSKQHLSTAYRNSKKGAADAELVPLITLHICSSTHYVSPAVSVQLIAPHPPRQSSSAGTRLRPARTVLYLSTGHCIARA
eukprot:1799161-Rhodomonas_salina.2